MGNEDDAFINAYNENISIQVEEVLESSDLAVIIRQLVNEEERTFEGTATELLTSSTNLQILIISTGTTVTGLRPPVSSVMG